MSKFIIIAFLAACSSTNETTTPTGTETVNTETTNKTVNDVKTTPVSNSTGSPTNTIGNSQKVEDQTPAVKEFVKKSVETSETTDAKTDTTSTTAGESKE